MVKLTQRFVKNVKYAETLDRKNENGQWLQASIAGSFSILGFRKFDERSWLSILVIVWRDRFTHVVSRSSIPMVVGGPARLNRTDAEAVETDTAVLQRTSIAKCRAAYYNFQTDAGYGNGGMG